jgi:hypothetical protein
VKVLVWLGWSATGVDKGDFWWCRVFEGRGAMESLEESSIDSKYDVVFYISGIRQMK